MDALLQKMNYKNQAYGVVLNAPIELADTLKQWETQFPIHIATANLSEIPFILAFATQLAAVEAFANIVATQTAPDALCWIAYPKATSKKYRCEFNRDTGWASLATFGFEPVRQIAIDADWSALRFRHASNIQQLTRHFALSAEGKAKAKPTPKTWPIPDDLIAVLDKQPTAYTAFQALPPSHQREYLRWIAEAKRPETRQRRIEETVKKLLGK